MSLVFYDTETTGTETYFDQILQFAAIQTDTDFNVLDRLELRCRLLPHVVPAPGAMSVTGATVAQLTDPTLPSHYEMVRSIHAKFMAWSPALFIGWNSLGFDEDLIRQALYKTLHNPYLTNRVGNSRSDVMRIAQACSLLAPDALKLPTNENGQKIFKLDRVAPANGFQHDQAHDAMGDVQATIFLSRLINENAPEIWSSFMRFSTKAAVASYVTEEQIFCMNEFYFGKPYSYVVTAIGQNQENTSEWYLYDLSVAPESLITLSDTQLSSRLDQQPKPIRRMKSNAAPMLFPAEDAPRICKAKAYKIEELERRAAILQSDDMLRQRLVSVLESGKTEYPASPHIEKQIYDGFFEKSDEKLMELFHQKDWPKRRAIVEKFQDPRLREIGIHLIYLERPDLLDEATCRKHAQSHANRLLGRGDDITWLTLSNALKEIEDMLRIAEGKQRIFLQEHERYLRELNEHAAMQVD